MASLLNGVGNRSTSVLKALLAARDAFGRTADHLIQTVNPATAPCLIAALHKAEKSAADDDDNEEDDEEEVLNAVKSLKCHLGESEMALCGRWRTRCTGGASGRRCYCFER